MRAGVNGKVNCVLWRLSSGPISRRIGHAQAEARRGEFDTAKFEHLAATLKNWIGRLYEWNPETNEPTTPKMWSAPPISHTRVGATEGRHEDCSVRAAKVEGDVESLASQGAKNLP